MPRRSKLPRVTTGQVLKCFRLYNNMVFTLCVGMEGGGKLRYDHLVCQGLNEAAGVLAETAHMLRKPAMFRSTCEYAIQMAANELLSSKGVGEATVTVTTAMATAAQYPSYPSVSLRILFLLPKLTDYQPTIDKHRIISQFPYQ